MSKIYNLVGKRFGKLMVLKRTEERRDGSIVWLCKCDCGRETTANSKHLVRSKYNIRSCGCLKFLRGKDHRDWKGVGEISGHWWSAHIKTANYSPLRSRMPITITKKSMWKLFLKQGRKCALTGLPLVISEDRSNTASIDRIDSTKGYVPKNVQFVHKDINMMKRIYSQDYFIELCLLVTQKRVSNEDKRVLEPGS